MLSAVVVVLFNTMLISLSTALKTQSLNIFLSPAQILFDHFITLCRAEAYSSGSLRISSRAPQNKYHFSLKCTQCSQSFTLYVVLVPQLTKSLMGSLLTCAWTKATLPLLP